MFLWERNEIPMFLGISTKTDVDVLLEYFENIARRAMTMLLQHNTNE